MSEPTVAAFLLDRLAEWGLSRAYGDPGDGINDTLREAFKGKLAEVTNR